MTHLPIDDVLPKVVASLKRNPNLVVLAPPGAGKTTRLPPRLVDEGLVPSRERVWVLEPRRLAARMSAQRVAEERKVRLGAEVGYQVRFDDQTSKKTRITYLTEGILTRRLQSDPLLEGVGAVVLDEFHERSIHTDLALAFLKEIQTTVRPELKIVVMSATLDPAPIVRFLNAESVVSEGRAHPVEVRWLSRPDDRPPLELAVSGIRRAKRETEVGDILAFLPGAGEIRRTQEKLQEHLDDVDLCPLYGELDTKAQDRAVQPGARRKVILATNIAESALTIEGVRTIVDLGLHKVNRFDPKTGIDRLETIRISRRSAVQRTGRAGRLGPGIAYRLWTEKEETRFAAEDAPEIRRIDLCPVILDVLRWSASNPVDFGWFESPAPAVMAKALELLRQLGVVDKDGFQLTALGTAIARFPLHPRLAILLTTAHDRGLVRYGALLGALASERDVRSRRGNWPMDEVGSSDLWARIERLEALQAGAGRPETLGLDGGAAKTVLRVADRLEHMATRTLGAAPKLKGSDPEAAVGRLVLAGFPDRVARRRTPKDDRIVHVGGGGGRLSAESVVKDAPLLIAVQLDAGPKSKEGWVRWASQVDAQWLAADTPHVVTAASARWNPERQAAEAVIETRYLDLVLSEKKDPNGDPDALSQVLEAAAKDDLDRALPLTDAFQSFANRYRFLKETMPDLDLAPIGPEVRLTLLPELCYQQRSFADLKKADWVSVLRRQLPQTAKEALAKHAPTELKIPSGRNAKLHYRAEGPPRLSVRLQEVFGLYDTPKIAGGKVPVLMELLAPNQRPVQVTQDLRSFWENTYAEVRKELRRRYPKHQWPEDPKEGIASTRVRPRRS